LTKSLERGNWPVAILLFEQVCLRLEAWDLSALIAGVRSFWEEWREEGSRADKR